MFNHCLNHLKFGKEKFRLLLISKFRRNFFAQNMMSRSFLDVLHHFWFKNVYMLNCGNSISFKNHQIKDVDILAKWF